MFWLSDVFTGTESAERMRLYEADARAARTRITRRTLAATQHFLARLGTSATRDIVRRIRCARQRRELVQALNRLDDHYLKDIGLTRDDVFRLKRGEWPTCLTDESEKPAIRRVMSAREDACADAGEERQAERWRRAA